MEKLSGTILVVEDDNIARKIFCQKITEFGARAVEAKDGEEALEILKTTAIDVVLSDLVMPGISGVMLLHSMLERECLIPFILATGYSDKDSAIQALRLGAFDYLEKPVADQDLHDVLAEALRASRNQSKVLTTKPKHYDDDTKNDAAFQILRMRILRRNTREDQDGHTFSGREWGDLKDFFVEEASSQLIFCDASLINLLDGIDGERELSYVYRVIHALRSAADLIHVHDIAEFAGNYQTALASARLNIDGLTRDQIKTFQDANTALKEKVKALDDVSVIEVKLRLNQIVSQFTGDSGVQEPSNVITMKKSGS